MTEPKLTDENLKRLKEYREKYQYFNVPTAWDVNVIYDLIDALIARLEAAEKALVNSEYQEVNEYFEAWRKASGK